MDDSSENVAQPAEVALLRHGTSRESSATSAGCATLAAVFIVSGRRAASCRTPPKKWDKLMASCPTNYHRFSREFRELVYDSYENPWQYYYLDRDRAGAKARATIDPTTRAASGDAADSAGWRRSPGCGSHGT